MPTLPTPSTHPGAAARRARDVCVAGVIVVTFGDVQVVPPDAAAFPDPIPAATADPNAAPARKIMLLK